METQEIVSLYRVVRCQKDGKIVHTDYATLEKLLAKYEQLGIEEDSYTLRLHGQPTLKGLVGPMSEGKTGVRYETPDAFVKLTEQWSQAHKAGRRRRRRRA